MKKINFGFPKLQLQIKVEKKKIVFPELQLQIKFEKLRIYIPKNYNYKYKFERLNYYASRIIMKNIFED